MAVSPGPVSAREARAGEEVEVEVSAREARAGVAPSNQMVRR